MEDVLIYVYVKKVIMTNLWWPDTCICGYHQWSTIITFKRIIGSQNWRWHDEWCITMNNDVTNITLNKWQLRTIEARRFIGFNTNGLQGAITLRKITTLLLFSWGGRYKISEEWDVFDFKEDSANKEMVSGSEQEDRLLDIRKKFHVHRLDNKHICKYHFSIHYSKS